MNRFVSRIAEHTGQEGLYAAPVLQTLQVNIGLKCDLACAHCHVVSSPRRTEAMTWQTMQQVISAARKIRPCTIDITGGAPELNPNFRRFVTALAADHFEVLVRTNLTVFFEPGMDDIPEFYRDHQVTLVASLPCYLEENVDAQRGDGVYEKSTRALRRLNELGYGIDPALKLDLIYNPAGPQLPPDQGELFEAYTRELADRFGIRFTRLLTITNMPIGRFLGDLRQAGHGEAYERLLESSFNSGTIESLMCRHQVSVRWDGTLFDCDFNLALKMPLGNGAPAHIADFEPALLAGRRVATGDHCFGCTAGAGSSCGGALVQVDCQEIRR
ncbi:MAG: arsenosugar biosynthesis radical SAM (seleno)protein ArsS [Phycisphaerae bacterium]